MVYEVADRVKIYINDFEVMAQGKYHLSLFGSADFSVKALSRWHPLDLINNFNNSVGIL